MRVGKRRAFPDLAAMLCSANIAQVSLGALACLLPCCAIERSTPSAISGDATNSVHQAVGVDVSEPSRARIDAGRAASPESMQVRTGGPAALTQSDFKVPFYPGAIIDTQRCQRLQMGTKYSNTVVHSTTASVKTVRAFYRKKLRESTDGRAIVESGDGDNVTLIAKRSETDITMVVLERDPELGIVEITQQQLGEPSAN